MSVMSDLAAELQGLPDGSFVCIRTIKTDGNGGCNVASLVARKNGEVEEYYDKLPNTTPERAEQFYRDLRYTDHPVQWPGMVALRKAFKGNRNV